MSVRPVTITRTGLGVYHDDLGHGGVIPLAQLRFAPDGTPGAKGNAVDQRVVTLTCPVCGATSYHPISGGAARSDVQRLFALVFMRNTTSLAQAKAAILQAVGQDEWALTDDDLAAIQQAAGIT